MFPETLQIPLDVVIKEEVEDLEDNWAEPAISFIKVEVPGGQYEEDADVNSLKTEIKSEDSSNTPDDDYVSNFTAHETLRDIKQH